MRFRGPRLCLAFLRIVVVVLAVLRVPASAFAQNSSSASHAHPSQKMHPAVPSLDAGSVSAGVYRNSVFGFVCKIPAGWVLRTEEMNAREDADSSTKSDLNPGQSGRVLLGAFSRPPEARAEDVNASILIAAENAADYPGLKEPAQYFGPVIEAAKAQGLEIDDEPYEFAVGSKKLVRGDFQKDLGTRVLRQSTLVMLARGYVVSFTFIGGTEEEVEELIAGLNFGAPASKAR
jgi:hypothetical protein